MRSGLGRHNGWAQAIQSEHPGRYEARPSINKVLTELSSGSVRNSVDVSALPWSAGRAEKEESSH